MKAIVTVKWRIDKCTLGFSKQFFYNGCDSVKIRTVDGVQFLRQSSRIHLLLHHLCIGNVR